LAARHAISAIHRLCRLPDPTSRPPCDQVFLGLIRSSGTPAVPRALFTPPLVVQLLAALPNTRDGVRDRAIVLLTFAAALRVRQLIALDVNDLGFGEVLRVHSAPAGP
jgi:integrase